MCSTTGPPPDCGPQAIQWQDVGVPDTLRFVLIEVNRLTLKRQAHELRAVGPDGSDGDVIAMVRAGMLLGKSATVFYRDAAMREPMFGFAGGVVREDFEVIDTLGTVLGSFNKVWKKSVLRSTWNLTTPQGLTAIGRERSRPAALLRRLSDDVPFLVVHFDFVTDDGHTVLSSVRRRTIRREYELSVPALPDGRQLDWRVAAAMGAALAVVQTR
jgi:hypothetical protein